MTVYLQEPRGGGYLNLIEAALERNMRPTTYILRVQPFGKWSEFDFICGEAYKIVQNERCHQCGLPRWMCHSDDSDIQFRVVEDTCFAMKEVETVDEKKSGKKGYKPPKGVKARPEPYTTSGKVLGGDFREAFYKAEYEKANPESHPDVA